MNAIDGFCSSGPRTWSWVAATLAAVLSAACVDLEPEDGADDDVPALGTATEELGAVNHEITFYAGKSGSQVLYVESLKACGRNQYDQYVCYTRTWPSWTMGYSWTIANWWWQMPKGVRLDFVLSGYGPRNCTVYDKPWWTNRVRVDYLGNNTCTTSGW